jgi:hypothetical protein
MPRKKKGEGSFEVLFHFNGGDYLAYVYKKTVHTVVKAKPYKVKKIDPAIPKKRNEKLKRRFVDTTKSELRKLEK